MKNPARGEKVVVSRRLAIHVLAGLWGDRSRNLLVISALAVGSAAFLLSSWLGHGYRSQISKVMEGFVPNSMVVAGRPVVEGGSRRVFSLKEVGEVRALVAGRGHAAMYQISGDIPIRNPKSGADATAGSVYSMSPSFTTVQIRHASTGRDLTEADDKNRHRVAVIGRTVERNLFGAHRALGKTIRIANEPFEVVGVLEARGVSSGGSDLDDTVFITFSAGQDLFGLKAEFPVFMVSAIPGQDIHALAEEILDHLTDEQTSGERARGSITLIFADQWEQKLWKASRNARNLGWTVAAIALLAGAGLLLVTMLGWVHGRLQEIGIKRAVGATRGTIRWEFVIASVIVSLGAFAGGLALAFLVEWQVSARQPEMMVVSVPPLFVSGSVVVAIAVAASLIPAARASAQSPIAALGRYGE